VDAVDGDSACWFSARKRVVQRRVESHDVVPNEKWDAEHMAPGEAMGQEGHSDVPLSNENFFDLGVDAEMSAHEVGVLLCEFLQLLFRHVLRRNSNKVVSDHLVALTGEKP